MQALRLLAPVSVIVARIRSSPLVRNTGYQLLNQGFSVFVSLGTFALITRSLGTSGYGAYGLALTIAAFVGIALDAGLDTYVVNALARSGPNVLELRSTRELVSEAALLRVLLGFLATAVAEILCLLVGYPPEVVVGVVAVSSSALLNSICSILSDLFQARLDVRLAVFSSFVARLTSAVFIVWFAAEGALTIWAVLGATVVGSAIALALVVLIAYRRGLRLAVPSPRRSLVLYRYTAPLAAWVVLGQIIHRADAIILSIVPLDRSVGLTNQETVGIYVAAYKFFDLSNALPGYLVVTMLPVLAVLSADGPALRTYLRRWLPRMSFMGLGVGTAMAILGGPVLLFLSGPSFSPSAPIVIVLSGAMGLAFVTSLLFAAIVALGRRRSLGVLYLAVAVGNVAANFILDRWWAYWGAAWLTTISQALILLGMVWILRDLVAWKR